MKPTIDELVKEEPKKKEIVNYFPGWAFNLTNNPPAYNGWSACVEQNNKYQDIFIKYIKQPNG